MLVAFTHHDSNYQVPLTKDRYPTVPRGKYASLQERDIHFFQSTLEPSRVLVDESDVAPYNVDWLRMVRGKVPGELYV